MLTQGRHELRIYMESGDFNLNYVDVRIIADINCDGSFDWEDLAEMAEQWLWSGIAGSINEDVAADGCVNSGDFAVLARQWVH